jgi:hypothetical protein
MKNKKDDSDLSEIATTMKLESPVFIVGAPRSGTSLLYRTLQGHSSFKPQRCKDPSGVELTESKIFKDPYSTYSVSNSIALAYLLGDKDYYYQFLELTQPIQKYQSWLIGKGFVQKAMPKINIFRAALWRGTQNDVLIRVFLYFAKQARGMKRIIEKTPQHISRLPEIKETFPETKLLFIHRHPIDVYSSYQRRLKVSMELGVKQQDLNWLRMSVREFCNKHTNYIQLALKEKASNPKKIMLISYDDLVGNHQATLHRICDFLEEPYERECLPEKPIKKNDWEVDPNLFGEIKKETKNWKDFISEVDARFIEKRMHKVMHKLNYPRRL